MKESNQKDALTNFVKMFETFGKAIGQIFDDPELKAKAGEFGKSAVEAANTLGDRFKDEDVQQKFRDIGKAAQEFGKSIEDTFRDTRNKKES
jgi:hypothetical protein